MLLESWNSLEIDVTSRFKALWVTNALDGSEDYLVSERVFALVRKASNISKKPDANPKRKKFERPPGANYTS